MRSAFAWTILLAVAVAGCGTPIANDDPGAALTTTSSSQADQSSDPAAPDSSGAEVAEGELEDDSTPTTATEQSPPSTLDDGSVESAGESEPGEAREESADDRGTKEADRVEEEPVSQPVVGEVPAEMMARVMDDLANRTGAAVSAFTVVRAESVVWSDGSLGCGKPGETYTMATVDGYWIEVGHGDDIHDYRASANGYFFYCEGGGSLPVNPNG